MVLKATDSYWLTEENTTHSFFKSYFSLGGCGGPERTEFVVQSAAGEFNRRIHTGYVPGASGHRRRPWLSQFSFSHALYKLLSKSPTSFGNFTLQFPDGPGLLGIFPELLGCFRSFGSLWDFLWDTWDFLSGSLGLSIAVVGYWGIRDWVIWD